MPGLDGRRHRLVRREQLQRVVSVAVLLERLPPAARQAGLMREQLPQRDAVPRKPKPGHRLVEREQPLVDELSASAAASGFVIDAMRNVVSGTAAP